MPRKPQAMLNLAQVSRRLDLPYVRLNRLLHQGLLIPDAIAGRFALFREESVLQVEQRLTELGLVSARLARRGFRNARPR